VLTYQRLAAAAAWAGNDTAAADFLANAQEGYRAVGEPWPDDERPVDLPWLETLLAGAAEGRLPRKALLLYFWMFDAP
jgi:hypothetical protein